MPTSRGKRSSKRQTSPSMELYVETIAHLLTFGKVCSVSDIADRAGVSRAAASRAVRDLAEKDLVEHKSYGYVDLTARGRALARALTARHRALYAFLSGTLRFDDDWADREACRLEHLLDDELVDRLTRLSSFLRENGNVAAEWQRYLESLSTTA